MIRRKAATTAPRRPPPVVRRHRQPGLTSVVGLAGNPVKQKRPAGDRLAVVIGVRQAHEQAPPVVDERDQPRHVLAAFQVARGEAAPAPLVLQLVEGVLRVRPIPVELGNRSDLQIQRRRQNRELPDPRARLRVGPEQIALAVIAPRQRHRPRQATAQHNHATRPAPALQAKLGLDPRPALSRVLPLITRHQALGKPARSLRQAQLEQIVETRPLARRHVALAAPILVAPDKARPVLPPEALKQGPQRGRRALRAMTVARRNINVQHKARARHQERMVGVRGTARLLRVVAHNRPLLVAVERLDRRVAVENPRLAQQRPHRVVEMAVQPRCAVLRLDPLQAAPNRILARHLAHAQQRRIDPVAAQRRDVRIAPLPRESRQKHRSQDVPLRRRVRARVVQRAVRHQRVEAAADFQVFGEERQVTQRRRRRIRIPFDVDRAAEGVHLHGLSGDLPHSAGTITRRVTLSGLSRFAHPPSLQGFSAISPSPNCRI